MGKALSWIMKALGIVLAIGLLMWTIRRTNADPLGELSRADWRFMLSAFACIGLSHVLGAFRWGRLLAVQDIRLGRWLLFKLTLVGIFFSQLIPGAVSGDFLKIAYVANRCKGRGTEAFLTIILDRILGVAGLFCVASIGGALFWIRNIALVSASLELKTALILVFAGGMASLLGLWVLLYHRWIMTWPGVSALLQLGMRLGPSKITDFLARLCHAADLYKHTKRTLLQMLALSMFIHSILGTALFFIGRGVGEHQLSYEAYFLSMQIGNAVTMVAVTPGGLGLRDTVSAAVFSAMQTTPSGLFGSIPVINSMLCVFWGMTGALCLGFLGARPQHIDAMNLKEE